MSTLDRVVLTLILVSLSTVRSLPLEALRSLVVLRSIEPHPSFCLGVQLEHQRVLTSAACKTSSLDSAAFVAEPSFAGGDGVGLLQLALQPPQALSISTSVDHADLAMPTNGFVVRVLDPNGGSAPSSLALPPLDSSLPGVLSEDTSASILEVDPATLRVSVVDQVIYVNNKLCSTVDPPPDPQAPSACVLPLRIDDREASPLVLPWRFLVSRNATTATHTLLGVGLQASAAQEADGFRLFALLNHRPAINDGDESRILGSVVDKITPSTEFVTGIRASRTGNSFCTGSLVASRIVLTAAHCLFSGRVTWVAVGADKTKGASGEMIRVAYATRHQSFQTTKPIPLPFDFLLLELERASSRTPIRLATDSFDEFLGKRATVFGYGATAMSKDLSKELRSVEVTLGPAYDVCATQYNYPTLDGTMLCAEAGVDKGTCSGDSGGPYVLDVGTPNQRLLAIHGGGKRQGNENKCGLGRASWALLVSSARSFIRTAIDSAAAPTSAPPETIETFRPTNGRPGHTQA